MGWCIFWLQPISGGKVHSGGDDAILVPAIQLPTEESWRKRRRDDVSVSDAHVFESDNDNSKGGLSESDYDSDSDDDTAPVEIDVNLEFSVQDITDA